MMNRWFLFPALLVLLFLQAGCPVPIEFKQDAFDIAGEYRLDSIKVLVGKDELTPNDQFTITNETAFYDVRLKVIRKSYTSLERSMFDQLPVSSEKDYLLKHILLGAGYRDIDSSIVESRENLSKDGGQTAQLTLSSRYWQLADKHWSQAYIQGDDGLILYCTRSADVDTPSSRREGNSCREWIKNGRITHQSFRYTFKGSTLKGATTIQGEFRLETKTWLRVGTATVRIYSVLWSNEIKLNRQNDSDSNDNP